MNETIDASHTGDGHPLLVLVGEFDLSSVEALEEAARSALGSSPSRIVLDASGVTFLNSSILGALLRIQRRAADQGTGFALQDPSSLVQRLLRLSGLLDQIEVVTGS